MLLYLLNASLRPEPETLIEFDVFQASSYCSPAIGEETKCQAELLTFTLYVRLPVEVPLTIKEPPLFIVKSPVIVKFPLIVKEFAAFIVKVSLAFIIIFPAKAVVPELIIGGVATFGIETKEELVGIPLSQFPAKFQVELVSPVQTVVFVVKASWEKPSDNSPLSDSVVQLLFVSINS